MSSTPSRNCSRFLASRPQSLITKIPNPTALEHTTVRILYTAHRTWRTMTPFFRSPVRRVAVRIRDLRYRRRRAASRTSVAVRGSGTSSEDGGGWRQLPQQRYRDDGTERSRCDGSLRTQSTDPVAAVFAALAIRDLEAGGTSFAFATRINRVTTIGRATSYHAIITVDCNTKQNPIAVIDYTILVITCI